MTSPAALSSTADRFAAAAFGALVGSVVATIMLGALLALPLGLLVGCVLALPSVLLLTVFTEVAARAAPTAHASLALWVFGGLLATTPLLFWLGSNPFGYGRNFEDEIAIGLAAFFASVAAWALYVRRSDRLS